MTKLTVGCSQCDLEFAVRDNGYTDPSRAIWCPFCGSRKVERLQAMATETAQPEEAA